jgi:hypothetical protein
MNTKFKAINTYILNFLTETCSEEAVRSWSEKKNQSKFKSLVNKKGKVLDPNAPKRSKSAYLFFCTENREKVKNTLKNPSATNVTKELGKRWNKLKAKQNSKEYKKFLEMAEKDAERYRTQKEAYSSTLEETKGPKRSKSAYLYFCEEQRENVKSELGDVATTKITTRLGELWNKLKKEGDITKYQKLAEKDKKRYQSQKEKTTTTTKKTSKKVQKEKTTRKKTGYQIFCSLKRPELKAQNPEMEAKDITREISRLWKALDAEEKNAYTGQVKTK